MEFSYCYRDREYTVNVDKEEGVLKVALNGREYPVKVMLFNQGFLQFSVGDRNCRCTVGVEGPQRHIFYKGKVYRITEGKLKAGQKEEGSLTSPISGKIVKLLVEEGQEVKKGAPIMILEAMKMEHTVKAPKDGVIKKIFFKPGDQVDIGVQLVDM
ncbi:MAG: hypothetical protein DRG33_08280 [Deltaproteobacteria bacterium]|nr:MAG: hypothetical protein DRG33_08280 [Deltaproteobacteria bacterium]